MCGIVGFVSSCQNRQDVLDRMLNRIRHKRPDDAGIYMDSFVSLGHRRLSIIDIESGKQPMIYDDYVVIFNGEIYNYVELKQRLEKSGHCFISHSDTEVLLHAYKEYGYHMLQYLRGMFAFVIYDKSKEELFIARDHFGMKPLYYYHYQDHFLFGSEIKSFLEYPLFIKEFNSQVLDMYLKLGFVPGEETFFKHVKQLLPGHSVSYKNNHLNIHQYYQLSFDNHGSQEDMVARLEKTIKK